MQLTLKTLMIAALIAVAMPASAMHVTGGAVSGSGANERTELSELVANQGGCMTLSQAVEQVRRQYKGRIVSAETRVSGKQETHVIKVLTEDGKVKTVRIRGCRRN